MIICPSCNHQNPDGTLFCVNCGTQLKSVEPEMWKTPVGGASAGGGFADPDPGAGSPYRDPNSPNYIPPPPAANNYPTYTPPQSPQYQQNPLGGAEPMHPAIPAVLSLIIPGAGLFLVPNKQQQAIMLIVGFVLFWIVAFVLSFVFVGLCLMVVSPLLNVAAAIHSWDESAKTSGGRYQPILFK